MLTSPELVESIQRQRAREIAESRLVRIARFARQCCDASETTIDRLFRSLRRPEPQCC